MSDDLAYVPMSFLDKRVEAVMNACAFVQKLTFPDCCYQISEAMAFALNELGVPAHAQACDVYAWNADFLRYKNGEPIKAPRVKQKNTRHPQRKRRGAIKTRPDLDPYTLALYHEQEVEGGGYNGHVICIADGWVLDATASQFHRPHKKVRSTFFNAIPLDAFIHPDMIHPNFQKNWVEDKFMVKTSMEQGLISISNVDYIRKNGQMAYCLRPDIDPDNWWNHTTTAKTNIPECSKWVLDIAKQILASPDLENHVGQINIQHLWDSTKEVVKSGKHTQDSND